MDWDFVPLYRPEGCTQFNDISRGPLLLGLRVQVGLNKGEARNSLARAIFFNRRAADPDAGAE